jgi:hypothetical protein
MTSASTQAGLTVRTFLLGSGPEDDTTRIRQLLSENDVVGTCGRDLTRLTQQGREAAGQGGPGDPADTRPTGHCPARYAPDHLGLQSHRRVAGRRR